MSAPCFLWESFYFSADHKQRFSLDCLVMNGPESGKMELSKVIQTAVEVFSFVTDARSRSSKDGDTISLQIKSDFNEIQHNVTYKVLQKTWQINWHLLKSTEVFLPQRSLKSQRREETVYKSTSEAPASRCVTLNPMTSTTGACESKHRKKSKKKNET